MDAEDRQDAIDIATTIAHIAQIAQMVVPEEDQAGFTLDQLEGYVEGLVEDRNRYGDDSDRYLASFMTAHRELLGVRQTLDDLGAGKTEHPLRRRLRDLVAEFSRSNLDLATERDRLRTEQDTLRNILKAAVRNLGTLRSHTDPDVSRELGMTVAAFQTALDTTENVHVAIVNRVDDLLVERDALKAELDRWKAAAGEADAFIRSINEADHDRWNAILAERQRFRLGLELLAIRYPEADDRQCEVARVIAEACLSMEPLHGDEPGEDRLTQNDLVEMLRITRTLHHDLENSHVAARVDAEQKLLRSQMRDRYLRALAHIFPHVNTDMATNTEIGLPDAEDVWCLGCTVATALSEYDDTLIDEDDDVVERRARAWIKAWDSRVSAELDAEEATAL